MADQNAKIDDNNRPSLLGIDESSGERRRILTDATGAVKIVIDSITATFLDLSDTPSSYSGQTGKVVAVNATEDGLEFIAAGGGGTVSGPVSSTDNAIPRWDGTGGDTLQDSGVTIDDSDNLSGVNNVTGADANFVTGTAGTNGNLLQWDASGDAVDSSIAAADVLVDSDIGSTVQAYSSNLDDFSAKTAPTGDVVGTSDTQTLTNKTFDANGTGNSLSNVDVEDLADGTDGELITWDATGSPSTVAVGTAGQVLTSNGAGAAPTFQDASGGGTPRYNLNPQMNTMSAGTGSGNGSSDPFDVPSGLNGLRCTANTDAGESYTTISSRGALSSWDFYDNNPEFTITETYRSGSSTGNGVMWFGDMAGPNIPPSRTQTNKGMFIIVDTVSGTPTTYAVNADGTSNTNTSLSGISYGGTTGDVWRVVKDGTTNIKFYYNYTLKATHTTNLPSGDCASTEWFVAGVANDSGDTTSRSVDFGYFTASIDSATG